MKPTYMLAALAAAIYHTIRGEKLAANTYDAAVETHIDTVTRTNDAAVTARHLLWKAGAAAGGIALSGISDYPLGTVDNTETETGMRQTVKLLGRGPTKKMVASVAIDIGDRVFAAASGKVSKTFAATTACVGIALTATTGDGQILEVNDQAPARTVT